MATDSIYQSLVHSDTALRKKLAETAKQWHNENRDAIIEQIVRKCLVAASPALPSETTQAVADNAYHKIYQAVKKDWENHLYQAAGNVVSVIGDKEYALSPFCVIPNPDWGDEESSIDWTEQPKKYIKMAKDIFAAGG